MVTKQKVILRIAILAFVIGVSSAVFGGVAFAADCTGLTGDELAICEGSTDSGSECGDVKTSIIGGENICGSDGESTIFNLLVWVLKILTAGVGVAAVGGIGYGALLYTTAEGKPDQTKKAISIITNVVIGIAAYALMAVLLNFIIPGGILQ